VIPGETVSDWTKHVTIQNTGDMDCYVRAIAFAGSEYQLTYSGSDKWTPGSDGYYYYEDIVPAKGQTEDLQIRIDIGNSTTDFNVIVVQECTPVLYDADGNACADWNVIADTTKDSFSRKE
jgi:hypothetical protein